MPALLLDTHAWAWTLTKNDKLSSAADQAISEASGILVSPISFYEIGQKLRAGKWLEMATSFPNLSGLLAERGGRIAVLTSDIAALAAALDWPHRDPFDRMIAATAIHLGVPLASADTAFDGLAGHGGWPGRVW